MLISHKHKFITIDIPKTGSRSLRESLQPLKILDIIGPPTKQSVFYQHQTAQECMRDMSDIDMKFNEYHSFCVVRNPWRRYYSFFKYYRHYLNKYIAKDPEIDWSNGVFTRQGESCKRLFENRSDKQALRHLIMSQRPQHEYYSDAQNNNMISHIAIFEDFDNEFVKFCTHVNVDAPALKHNNKSSSCIPMHDVYDQQLIDMVAEKEKQVIKLNKYEFE